MNEQTVKTFEQEVREDVVREIERAGFRMTVSDNHWKAISVFAADQRVAIVRVLSARSGDPQGTIEVSANRMRPSSRSARSFHDVNKSNSWGSRRVKKLASMIALLKEFAIPVSEPETARALRELENSKRWQTRSRLVTEQRNLVHSLAKDFEDEMLRDVKNIHVRTVSVSFEVNAERRYWLDRITELNGEIAAAEQAIETWKLVMQGAAS